MEYENLEKFTKQVKIGEGRFSKVYKIVEKGSEKVYAAKISKTELNDEDKTYVTHLKSEIKTISELNHPSLLKYFGFSPVNFDQKSYPTIITEFESNGSLEEILNNERQKNSPSDSPWNDTKKLINIYGIASGMSILHDREIIHRDLKPSNILEDDYLFPKIADFGLTKSDKNLTKSSEEKNIYMPPENWNNNEYSKPGDVYAFSIIVYEILTLEEPFKNMSNSSYLSTVIEKGNRPEFKLTVADCYKKLISRCWSKNKDERPTFKEIVNELKNNKDFITNSVDKTEFLDYINFVDSLGNSFDPSKKFKKVIPDENDFDSFEDLSQSKGFKSLSKELKDFIENNIKNQQSDKKTINVPWDKTKMMYDEDLFKSLDFISILKFFQKISFDVEHSSTDFKNIYNELNKLKKSKLKSIKINIITSHISNIKDFLKENGSHFTVTLLPSITAISENAFKECYLMDEITIPSSVLSIRSGAFSECNSLKEINFPSSLNDIGESAFFECSSFKEISIPTKVTLINDFTFQRCTKLVQVTLPSSLTLIGDYAFDNCHSLLEISIPSSVVKIGDFAFRECLALKLVKFDIHSSLNSIGDFAFRECKCLSAMQIPPHVISIGQYAFKSCSALINLSMTYSLTEVGNSAFQGCYSLAQITIPFGVPPIKPGSSDVSIITQITNPLSAKRKSLEIGSDVKIVKSTKCTIS